MNSHVNQMLAEMTLSQQVIIITVGLVLFGLWIFSLIDVVKREFIYPNSKKIWLFLLIILPPLGIILYFVAGRKQKVLSIQCLMRRPEKYTGLDNLLEQVQENRKKKLKRWLS